MKRLLTTLALALAFMYSAQADHVAVYGTLVKYKTDPRLLEELPSTPKEYLVIRFDKPFEIYHGNWEAEDGKNGKVLVSEFQVLYTGQEWSKIDALIGQKVIAIGDTSERDTAKQMTPILLEVESGNIKPGGFVSFQIKITASE